MSRRAVSIAALCAIGALMGGVGLSGAGGSGQADVTVHEWGTFTTVAGPDGQAQEWLPLGGPTDLPCFVETYKNRLVKFQLSTSQPAAKPFDLGPLLDYQTARSGLKGTVRMETPVVYFYARRATEVSVKVGFPKGLFTEWYPTANVVQLPSYANILSAPVVSTMEWQKVLVRPGARPGLPASDTPSHYYAARDTDAAPVQVNGQAEKFLFYRGVGGFSVPLAVRFDAGRLSARNLEADPIPAVVVFTNHHGKIGYRVLGPLDRSETFDRPTLTGDMPSLRRDLVAMLIGQGLYAKEAEAMVNTWRDTWFEEGTRVLYIVPKPAVDRILPLTVTPKPEAVERVFVGRMDVITPDFVSDVRSAFAASDRVALAKYGRLLSVVGDEILKDSTSAEERTRIEALLKATFASYLEAVGACD